MDKSEPTTVNTSSETISFRESLVPNCRFCTCLRELPESEYPNHSNVQPLCSMKMKMRRSCLRKQNTIYRTDIINGKKLRTSVSLNDTDRVRTLLESGVNANDSDAQKRSPLHMAACKGYTNMVQLLLQHGADPNNKDSLGNTPLHLAACTNNIEIVTLLLNAGTDVTSIDNCGRNPLQLAQSKLKLIKNLQKMRLNSQDMQDIREQVQQVVSMLRAFCFSQKRTAAPSSSSMNLDDLSEKLNKLKTSDMNDIDVEVSGLLNDLQVLGINK